MTDRITADILVEAFHLAKPDFDDLKDRIEEAAAAHKATVTVDGRLHLAPQPAVDPAVLPAPADRAADGIDWKAKYELEHARHVEVVRNLVTDRAAVLREAADFVGNDDDCDCGGCDSCVPNKLAAGLRRMADEAQQPEEALCGKTVGVGFPDHPYRPCARPAGHSEAYCRDATGQHYFLAAADQPDAEPEEAGR